MTVPVPHLLDPLQADTDPSFILPQHPRTYLISFQASERPICGHLPGLKATTLQCSFSTHIPLTSCKRRALAALPSLSPFGTPTCVATAIGRSGRAAGEKCVLTCLLLSWLQTLLPRSGTASHSRSHVRLW